MDWRFITRRSAVLAAVVGAGAALAVPAGAMAATGSNVFAAGSSFQVNAHRVWNTQTNWGAHTSISPFPTLSYNPGSSSGKGLSIFGNDDGTLKPSVDNLAPSGVLDGFVGSDDAPTPGQLIAAHSAGGANEITVPIAQAPVAFIVSLPRGVTISGRLDLLNSVLEQAVAGTLPSAGGYPANTWGAFLTANNTAFSETDPGSSADFPITLEVRAGGSGTSFAFKNYMNQIAIDRTNPNTADATVWTSPQSYLTSDENWPATAHITDNRGRNASGGPLAQSVASTPGTIGYINLSDAASTSNGGFTNTATASRLGTDGQQILYATEQNNGSATTGATFAEGSTDPSHANTAAGNCTTDMGSVPGWANAPTDPRASWNRVLASDTNIARDAGSSFYPDCAVTYDVAWDNYASSNLTAGYTNAGLGITPAGTFTTVKDYLGYITSAAGQTAVKSTGFNSLPDAVAAKAQANVAAIAFTPSDNGGGGGDDGSTPPTGGGSTPPTGGGSTPPPPARRDTSATNLRPKLTVSASAITVALSCPKTKASCTGKVTLTAKTKVKKGKKTVTRTITIGTGHVTLKGGQSKKLVVKLNSAGRKALKSSKKLAVTVKVSASDTFGGKKTTTLHATVKQPAAKKKK